LFQLRTTTIAGALSGAAGKAGYFSDLGGGANAVDHNGTIWTRISDSGVQDIATDADVTVTYMTHGANIRSTGTLTANRTYTLSTTNVPQGAEFYIVRQGAGDFVLSVVGAVTALLIDGSFCHYGFNGTVWVLLGRGFVAITAPRIVTKTAVQTVNNSTVLVNDSALTFGMAASRTYKWKLTAFYDTTIAADFKYRITGPAGPTAVRFATSNKLPSGGNLNAMDVAYSAADVAMAAAAGTGGAIMIEGIVQNGATAGAFLFQWAQNAADATNTNVLAGSTLEFQLIG